MRKCKSCVDPELLGLYIFIVACILVVFLLSVCRLVLEFVNCLLVALLIFRSILKKIYKPIPVI